MDGCPYSIFEDGRDVKEYIIPPKGYVFKSFRFDPDASNQIYDGRLIAEYEKESFNEVLKSNLWKFLLAIAIIAVIAIVAFLALGVFKDPKPKPVKDPKPIVTVTDTSKTDSNSSTVAATQDDTASMPKDAAVERQDAETTATTVEETPSLDDSQPADDPNVQFRKDFWNLIHQRTIMMDPYHNLCQENKNKVEGEEYDYLYHTILRGTPQFKEWSAKMRKVPTSELEDINTITDLKKKLNEIQP